MLAPTRECDAGEAESECGKGTQEMALHKRERERERLPLAALHRAASCTVCEMHRGRA